MLRLAALVQPCRTCRGSGRERPRRAGAAGGGTSSWSRRATLSSVGDSSTTPTISAVRSAPSTPRPSTSENQGGREAR